MSPYFLIAAVILTGVAVAALYRPLAKTSNKKLTFGVAIVLPAFVVGLYFLIGSPDGSSQEAHSPSVGDAGMSATATLPEKVGSVSSMTDALEFRLNSEGGSGQDWLLLAKSYNHLGRSEDSKRAYEMARSLGVNDDDLAAAFESGSASVSAPATPALIVGDLRLSDRAASIANAGDTVFIFARAPGNGGVPAAVLQKTVSDLPTKFELRDSNAMVPGVNLSGLDEVVVTARISRSGDATEALQGLEAVSPTIAVGNSEPLSLEIK